MYDTTLLIEANDDTSVAGTQQWIEDTGKDYAPRYGKGAVISADGHIVKAGTYTAPPSDLAQIIWDECHRYSDEGHTVHYAATVAQMVHETAGFQSAYWRERWNPGGIGAINSNPDLAIRFPDPQSGVRAHVAHLLVYSAGTNGGWVANDPRAMAVVAKKWDGKTKKWVDLNGRWAYPGATYGQTIITMANRLRDAAGGGAVAQAQIPGFIWHPADKNHYTPGRKAKVSGGAQHYTAGTNSLDWLSTTSNPPVSVHFLVKHDPTLADRGWQLVRLEDTAWTTAFANPYTVAIEYEHREGQPISDTAYEVLAQTWADITAFVEGNGLGRIAKVEGHRLWVNNPTLICPDGIDMARIQKRWKELIAPPPPVVSWQDPVTGHWVHEEFQSTYSKYGGVYIFGRPIEGAFMELHEGVDRLVQYFERAVMRHFPENQGEWEVQLDLLGTEEFNERYPAGR